MTDYLCARDGAEVVVRFNGGAQAGHTVVTSRGRHVFSHFGAGTFAGADTFLSEYFISNPLLFMREYARIPLDQHTQVFVDPLGVVTTHYDMLINQALEDSRGDQRHGSCGVGINETLVRSSAGIDPFVIDLWSNEAKLAHYLALVRYEWVPKRLEALGLEELDTPKVLLDKLDGDFLHACKFFKTMVIQARPEQFKGRKIVFEGAQGLLLDQNNLVDAPHLTSSNTGAKNAALLAPQMGVTDLQAVYVTRSYMTRHGAGPFPYTHIESLEDKTNVGHPYQGQLRFGKINWEHMLDRVTADATTNKVNFSLAITHCDQHPIPDWVPKAYEGYGPSRSEVIENVSLHR